MEENKKQKEEIINHMNEIVRKDLMTKDKNILIDYILELIKEISEIEIKREG